MPTDRWPGHAVLQVPVPPLDAFVRSRHQHHDPRLVGRDADDGQPFVHAHVTVLTPFSALPDGDEPWVAAQLGTALADCFDVDALDLVWYQQDDTHLVRRFPPGRDDGASPQGKRRRRRQAAGLTRGRPRSAHRACSGAAAGPRSHG